MKRLTHIGLDGRAQMVDVSAKPLSARTAIAKGKIELQRKTMELTCTARTVAQTGVEMEALTGVAVALLTIYDMCKAVDKEMRILDIHLVEKTKRNL